MAAVPLALNFNQFIEHRNLVPYKALFATETPILKGKTLCEFLINLDQREYSDIKAENLELQKVYAEDVRLSILAAGAIISVLGFIGFSCSDKYSGSHYAFPVAVTSAVACPSVLIAAFIAANPNNPVDIKISEIYDNRLLRLQDKIRSLEGRIGSTNDQQEKEQLIQAKDYFSLKQMSYLAEKTNKIKVTR